ncbi:MAG TPA: dihydrofolate reductase family protein [Mycobacteriales bacterium]
MSQVIVINSVTLDGVMQGPGRPEEDTRGGFALGGWAAPTMNDEVQAAVNQRVTEAGGLRLLLGRRSYEGMLGYWNTQDHPFKEGLNNAPKYVASTTLRDPAPWPNTTLLAGDVPDAVSALKRQPDNDLVIMGSGGLIQTLMGHGLIDEYMLVIHPRVLGAGRRLFPDGVAPISLHLVSATPTSTGALVAVYQPRR